MNTTRRQRRRIGATLAALAIALAACGSDGEKSGIDDPANTTDTAGTSQSDADTSGLDDPVASAQAGGELVYGLEAETPNGFNLTQGFCAPSCRMVAKAVFDPLAAVNSDGVAVPYLAKTIEANADATEWTIGLRDGVLFHDGTALDADAVKKSLDAQRESWVNASAISRIAEITVVDPSTVKITMSGPWAAFATWLATPVGYVMAPSMLDADDGGTHPVGTGPFVFDSWTLDSQLIVVKNPNYWQPGLPYLDKVTFKPMPDVVSRVAAFQSGDVDVIHTDQAEQIARLRTAGVRLIESDRFGESNYYQLNVARAPFDDLRVRQALAMATDVERIHTVRNQGVSRVANGPFPPGTPGHLDDSGYPAFDPDRARELIEEYEAEHGQIEISVMTTQSPSLLRTAELIQQMWSDVGVDLSIEQLEFTELLDRDISGDYDISDARLFGGADADLQYRWWSSEEGGTVGNIDDPEINAALTVIRTSTDRVARTAAAEEINRRFGEQAYYLWTSWTLWATAVDDDVVGLTIELPDGGGRAGAVLGDHWLTQVSIRG